MDFGYDSRFEKEVLALRGAWKTIDDLWSKKEHTQKVRESLRVIRLSMYKILDGMRDPSTTNSGYHNPLMRAGFLIQGLKDLSVSLPACPTSEKLDPESKIDEQKLWALEALSNLIAVLNTALGRPPRTTFEFDKPTIESLGSVLLPSLS